MWKEGDVRYRLDRGYYIDEADAEKHRQESKLSFDEMLKLASGLLDPPKNQKPKEPSGNNFARRLEEARRRVNEEARRRDNEEAARKYERCTQEAQSYLGIAGDGYKLGVLRLLLQCIVVVILTGGIIFTMRQRRQP